ncbi:MAG: phage terminase large subunit, partial [Pyrinomonadaceae bacterium]
HLHRISRGKCKRLMIFLPPRHGKSEMVTVRYAVWRLLFEPATNIVIGSYNQRLANRFSLRAKRIAAGAGLRTGEARERLQRADEWENESGGGVKAVGVGAGITGFGADLVIIDDPVKSREEAESANNRERIWDWYNDDICTRLEPEGAVIVIQTRWHVDDLAGRLLQRMKNGGEQWEVISLPALAEDHDPIGRPEGDALWPKRFTAKQLREKQVQMGSYSFEALYQQRPVPRDGAHFKRSWFAGKVIDDAPRGLRWFRGYDLAVSTRTSADYTASFRVAMDTKGNIYIADGFRKRIEFPEQRRYIIERIREERNTTHGIESALHGKAFVQDLMRDERLVNRNFKAITVDNDKFTRALSWQSRAEAGKVLLVRGPWNEGFLDELCSFPDGKHDDQVDAVSLAVQMMAQRPKGTFGF